LVTALADLRSHFNAEDRRGLQLWLPWRPEALHGASIRESSAGRFFGKLFF
jgi:hypothetical protein